MKKKFRYLFLSLLILLVIAISYFINAIIVTPPIPANPSAIYLKRTKVSDDFYVCGQDWLKKNENGLWEMYLEGDAFERGVVNGKLTKELGEKQEVAFISQIQKMIPSGFYLNFLKYFVAWFNKDLDQYIDEEYKQEIYGVSLSASDKYDFIGPKYQRILNYHAAHDIGHALQDKNMVVGCTSFSAWNGKTTDSSLIVGRNFDFYVGDEFAENKIVCFYNPAKGHKFMMVSWGGMIGAVSGMNEKGLTVTINASKSHVPRGAATPISIVAREILQYAETIDEAYAIAKKRKTFVSESILVSAVKDNKAAIIEKTPLMTDLFYSENENFIICSNHYQGNLLKDDEYNKENIHESSSMYRYQRMQELIGKQSKISVEGAASILRDRKGLKDKDIGLGNEKAMNQLIAHHSVIFKPKSQLAWVSAGPYQEGVYVAYDLNKVFKQYPGLKYKREISEKNLTIAPDSFLMGDGYTNYLRFKDLKTKIHNCIKAKEKLNDETIHDFIVSNPESYLVYMLLGDYYREKKEAAIAIQYYDQALGKEVATGTEMSQLKERINDCKKMLK